jgi:hypothetical protein
MLIAVVFVVEVHGYAVLSRSDAAKKLVEIEFYRAP